MNNNKRKLLVGLVVMAAVTAKSFATATPVPLEAVSEGLEGWKLGMVAIAATIIGFAAVPGGIKAGARWAKGLWNVMAR